MFGWLKSDSAEVQAEKVRQRVRKVAHYSGEVEYHRTMRDFYRDNVSKIDPHEEWWVFAHNRQKQHDHQQDLAVEERRLEEARAKLDAEKQRSAE